MGTVIELFFIGLILAVLHMLLGISLGFILKREYPKPTFRKGSIFIAFTAVLSFMLFTYGVGTRLCIGRVDMGSCVNAVLEVGLKMGIVLFPVIILMGIFGLFMGGKLAPKFKKTNITKPQTKKKKVANGK